MWVLCRLTFLKNVVNGFTNAVACDILDMLCTLIMG